MKKIISTIALSVVLPVTSYAVTITIDTAAFVNFSNGDRVTDNTGTVSIGTYDAIPNFDSSSSVADLLTSYDEFASGSFQDSFGGLDGFFGFTITEDIIPGSEFDGSDVYLVLGDGDTLASSDEFLVWRATANPEGNVFLAPDPVAGPTAVQLNNATGDLLFGSFDGTAFTLAETVPEPSSSALLGFGGLALILRRRR